MNRNPMLSNQRITFATILLAASATQQHPTASAAFVQRASRGVLPKSSISPSSLFSSEDGGMALPAEMEQALEQKNASRKKFGLGPMTLEEFAQFQVQVKQLEQEQLSKYQHQQLREKQKKEAAAEGPRFFDKFAEDRRAHV